MRGAGNRGVRSGLGLVFAVVLGSQTLAQGGVTWTPVSTGPQMNVSALASDTVRQRVVAFGADSTGTTSATSEWDGTNWNQMSPAVSPSLRFGTAMAYDSARQRVVLFGGHFFPVPGGSLVFHLGDTWEWDGTLWTQVATTGPSPRSAAMAYDVARGRVVLFGGYDTNGLFSDTWEWDGSIWTRATPRNSPPMSGPMAYDAGRQLVVLSGVGGTWEWDGGDWMNVGPPGPRGSMSYDSTRQRIVSHIWQQHSGWESDETWEWDGSTWVMTFYQSTIFGGPAGPGIGLISWDSVNAEIVGLSSATFLSTSLSPASFNSFGGGCPGMLGEPTLNATPLSLPWTGDSYSIELTNLPPGNMTFMVTGLSSTFWTGALIRLPASLVSWGMPGCTAYTDVAHSDLLINTSGTATWTQTVPNDATLIGLTFYNQGFIIDRGVNALGAIVSNAGESVIGMR